MKKLLQNKKLIAIVCTFCLIFAMAVVNASETPAVGDYSSLITQLNNGLGATAFTGVLGQVLPYIMAVTIVALVWYLIKRAAKKFAKGKPGV